MSREFTEITEEMVGLEEKSGCCSTVADLLIMGKIEEVKALKAKFESKNQKEEPERS